MLARNLGNFESNLCQALFAGANTNPEMVVTSYTLFFVEILIIVVVVFYCLILH